MDDRQLIDTHIRSFFAEHAVTEHQWNLGPTSDAMPEFRVLEIGPGERTACTSYISLGSHTIRHPETGILEFALLTRAPDARCIELVTMAMWFHRSTPLGIGHTLNIGEPWLAGSPCDHLLVSTPYPFGPDFEICNLHDSHVHCTWLLPITKQERNFKSQHGLEELEVRFDDAAIDFADPQRPSVV